jgi:hypothetical protein
MLFLRNVTFMTGDPKRLADFWSAALDLPERRDDAAETLIADADWHYPRLTFQLVTDVDDRSTRVHLDITADDRPAEIERLVGLGATEMGTVTLDGGWSWTVMRDPDGNELCVTDP